MYLTTTEAAAMPCPEMSNGTTTVYCNADGCPKWRWERTERTTTKGYCGAGGNPRQ